MDTVQELDLNVAEQNRQIFKTVNTIRTDGKSFNIFVVKHLFILFLLHINFILFLLMWLYFTLTSPVAFLDMGMIYPRAVCGLGCTRKHNQSFITYCHAPLLKEQELLQKIGHFI